MTDHRHCPGAVPPTPLDPLLSDLWQRAFGPKARDRSRHLLRGSIGLRRLTRFLSDVEAALGIRIPPTALMRLGTVDRLIAAIERGAWPEPSPLVQLREGEGADSLYVVSAGSGVVLELCDLVPLIDFPGPIWALQLPGLDGECEPLTGIEDIARHHADAILAAGHAGTSHIVGYSFGGLVAVELARRLRHSGRAVGLVGLIDATCYEKYWPGIEWAKVTLHRLGRRLAEMRSMSPVAAARHFSQRAGAVLLHIARRLRPDADGQDSGRSIYYIGGLEPNFQRVRDASIIAWEHFRPRPYDGPVVLFKSATGDPHACDPAAIWRPQVRALDIVVIPGSHVTILRKPLAARLADEIGRRLHPAQLETARAAPRLEGVAPALEPEFV